MALGVSPSGARATDQAGTWSGVLEAGSLRLRLKLTIAEDGSATLLSIDQSGKLLPGRATSPGTDGTIELKFDTIGARYAGRLVSSDRIEGIFHQGAGAFPLMFERGEAAMRPLPPVKPLDAASLSELRRQADAPGMAAACARKGFPAKFWHDGERRVGSGVAVQADDLWHIGSITKSMTSTLVARLVEDGVIRWDDTVGDVLGKVAPDMRDEYRRTTFRHLLSHHAGLQANIDIAQLLKFPRVSDDAREDRKAYARLALAQPPKGAIEITFEYSNSGYVIAGAMLETKLGKPWEDLVQARLFEPLGLASAGFGPPGHRAALDQPMGHARQSSTGRLLAFGPGDPADNPVVIGPAGRVHINLADLLRYLEAHRDDNPLLRPDSWKTLHTPPFSGQYAMGWGVRKDGSLIHSGSNTLWYAEALVNRADGIVAAAACNDGELPRATPAIGQALLRAEAAS
jgi:CubicO group peptidase (beta-lactamase class C family)